MRFLLNKLTFLLALTGAQLAGSVNLLAEEIKPVKVAVGFSMAPYVLKSGKGIIGSIISESFENSGMEVEFILESNRNAIELFRQKQVNAVSVVKEGMVEGKYSVPIVTFNNRVISLAENDIHIDAFADLANYRVIAFSNAKMYLGQEFSSAVESAVSYEEVAEQDEQVRKLYDGKADLIIADEKIFEFYKKQIRNQTPLDGKWQQEVSVGFAFPPNVYHLAFHEESHQQAFNDGFQQLRASGRHEQIVNTYLNLLGKY